jgi:hypothetical protein
MRRRWAGRGVWRTQGGEGSLGATIRFEQVSSPDQHAWHVLDIHPGSPAELAGLRPHTDFILSAVELIFQDEGDLEYVLSRCTNTAVAFYVYNATSDQVCNPFSLCLADAHYHP